MEQKIQTPGGHLGGGSKAMKKWCVFLTEDRKDALRQKTYLLTKQLTAILTELFPYESPGGWESWFLGVCKRSPDCRQALGIPAYYDEHLLAQIAIGRSQGLPRSHSLAVQLRVRMALSLLRMLLEHSLCPYQLTRFLSPLTDILQDMMRDASKGGGDNWEDVSPKKVHDMFTHAAANWLETRKNLRSFFAGSVDAELYAILLAIEKTRMKLAVSRRKAIRDSGVSWEDWGRLRKNLVHFIVTEDYRIDTNVALWWALAELLYEIRKDEPLNDDFKTAVSHLATGAALCKPRGESKVDHPGPFGQIPEYAETPSLETLYIAYSALSVLVWLDHYEEEAKTLLAEDLRKKLRTTCYKYIYHAYAWYGEEEKYSAVFLDDDGGIAVKTTKLFALFELWRWNTVYETLSCLRGDVKRRIKPPNVSHGDGQQVKRNEFGKPLNLHKEIKFSWPIWRRLADLPFPYPELGENGKPETKIFCPNPENKPLLSKMEGTQFSIMLFAPPGLGKGEIVNTLWKRLKEDFRGENKKYREIIARGMIIETTPSEMSRKWIEEAGLSKKPLQQRYYYVVFVDEIHIPSAPSVFGLLLKPLQEGSPFLKLSADGKERDERTENVPRAVYIFATSAYRSRKEFENAAAMQDDIAMRDFATRIGNWVELPDLFTIPEQKMIAAFLKAKKQNCDDAAARVAATWRTMDLQMRSVRHIKIAIENLGAEKTRDDILNKMRESNQLPDYPSWIKKVVEDSIMSSTFRV